MAYQNLVRRIKFIVHNARTRGFKHIYEVFYQAYIRRNYAKRNAKTNQHNFKLNHELNTNNSQEFLAKFAKNYSNNFPLSKKNNKEFFTNALLSLQDYNSILEEAEQLTEGKITLLGHSIYEPSGEFNWHKDYMVGKIYEKKYFNQYNFLSNDKSDVKRVWELSRMYWLWWIGKAFWVSKNGVWVKEFLRLIESWQTHNPTNFGLNWSMPMEVAIRGYWLTIGFGLFYGAPNIPDDWWCDYIKMVYDHADHLANNLEYFPNLTNHYVSNCFGLLAMGSFFYHTEKGKEWFEQGFIRLTTEIENQVLSDGVHYELSICYHRFVTEMFLISSILCKQVGKPLPSHALDKIEQMCEFINNYSQTCSHNDISVPQFGDSDDGLILRLMNKQNIYQHNDILSLAAVVFNRADFTEKCDQFSQAGMVLCGAAGYEQFRILQKQFQQQNKKEQKPSSLKIYTDSGFAILKNEYFFSVLDFGKIGLHGNNDVLSFVLHTKKMPVVIDPGTYCYTSEHLLRNDLRSSRRHNAPFVNDTEVAVFDGLWRVKQEIKQPTYNIISFENNYEIEFNFQTYFGADIKRLYRLEQNKFHVEDTVQATDLRGFSVQFCLHKNCIPKKNGEGKILIEIQRTTENIATEDIEIIDKEQVLFSCSEQIDIIETWYSPSYGIAESAWALVLNFQNTQQNASLRVEYEFELLHKNTE